jgi:hypothetical protein
MTSKIRMRPNFGTLFAGWTVLQKVQIRLWYSGASLFLAHTLVHMQDSQFDTEYKLLFQLHARLQTILPGPRYFSLLFNGLSLVNQGK